MKFNVLVVHALIGLSQWEKETSAFTCPVQTRQPVLTRLYSSSDKVSDDLEDEDDAAKGKENDNFFYFAKDNKDKGNYPTGSTRDVQTSWGDIFSSQEEESGSPPPKNSKDKEDVFSPKGKENGNVYSANGKDNGNFLSNGKSQDVSYSSSADANDESNTSWYDSDDYSTKSNGDGNSFTPKWEDDGDFFSAKSIADRNGKGKDTGNYFSQGSAYDVPSISSDDVFSSKGKVNGNYFSKKGARDVASISWDDDDDDDDDYSTTSNENGNSYTPKWKDEGDFFSPEAIQSRYSSSANGEANGKSFARDVRSTSWDDNDDDDDDDDDYSTKSNENGNSYTPKWKDEGDFFSPETIKNRYSSSTKGSENGNSFSQGRGQDLPYNSPNGAYDEVGASWVDQSYNQGKKFDRGAQNGFWDGTTNGYGNNDNGSDRWIDGQNSWYDSAHGATRREAWNDDSQQQDNWYEGAGKRGPGSLHGNSGPETWNDSHRPNFWQGNSGPETWNDGYRHNDGRRPDSWHGNSGPQGPNFWHENSGPETWTDGNRQNAGGRPDSWNRNTGPHGPNFWHDNSGPETWNDGDRQRPWRGNPGRESWGNSHSPNPGFGAPPPNSMFDNNGHYGRENHGHRGSGQFGAPPPNSMFDNNGYNGRENYGQQGNGQFGAPPQNSMFDSNGYNRRENNDQQDYGQRDLDGGSLQTFSSGSPFTDLLNKEIHVTLCNDGRPVEAEMTLWDGPNNAPQKVKTYCSDGSRNRFKGTFSGSGTLSIENTGSTAYPAKANVNASLRGSTSHVSRRYQRASLPLQGPQGMKTRDGALEIQGGGTLKTWPIVGPVQSATVELMSEGGPLDAVVELWQGAANVTQVAEIHSQDGYLRPYSMEVDLTGSDYGTSTIAIRNKGPLEYPIIARVSF